MLLKVFVLVLLLMIYQTLHLMILTLGAPAPTIDLEFTNLSDVESLVGGNVIPRILTHSDNSSTDEILGTLQQYKRTSYHNQDIIFPDAFLLMSKRNLGKEINPRCATKDAHFCEDIDSYPLHYLNHVLIRANRHKEFFGTDEEPIEIANRLGEPEETFICPSTVKTIFPKVGKNKDDVWKFIINQGDDDGTHVQGIRIETCAKLNEPCNLLNHTPFGYATSCKQKFVLRRLLSVDNHGQPIPDTFQIPSACCCSFRKDLSVLADSEKREVSKKRRRR